MSLKALTEEIETRSKSEAKAITDAAKKQAKGLKKEADTEVADPAIGSVYCSVEL